jgi:hypothetical protein
MLTETLFVLYYHMCWVWMWKNFCIISYRGVAMIFWKYIILTFTGNEGWRITLGLWTN